MSNITNNFIRLREVNSDLVRTVLKKTDSITKARLAEETGLSVATCGNILASMLETGEAVKVRLGISDGGRPPSLFTYNSAFAYTALVFPKSEDGKKHLIHAVVDAKGKTVERGALPVEQADLASIETLVADLASRHVPLKAIALSIPGLIRDGRVGFCDLPELEGVEVKQALENRFGLPVEAENDMNLAALGFSARRRDEDAISVAYLVVPKRICIGAGLVVNGRLLKGHTAFAGELSFLPGGISREKQFSGLSPEEALEYTGKLAATVIPVINPSILAVASDLSDSGTLERVRAICLERIPEEHMPKLVARRGIDDDCLAGLALMAMSSLTRGVRLVESEAGALL